MPYEMLVGLQVTNDEIYNQYRQAIAPLLKKYRGGFRYDFKVSEVLKSEADHAINRVFTIFFADDVNKEKFFSDPEYKNIKAELFNKSVQATTRIAEYSRKL